MPKIEVTEKQAELLSDWLGTMKIDRLITQLDAETRRAVVDIHNKLYVASGQPVREEKFRE